ncbi:MAG TPA: isoprenyl transferase [Candidatus Kapabacteria bacterium]|nr:isoprenyl transferase [Candidatus Kapabacteria bacterium]
MTWDSEINPDDKEKQLEIINSGKLPKHIAIIMDGNGRWALEHNFPRIAGHKQGIESVRDIVKSSSQLGIKFLTLYAFSIENWKRPAPEVNGLMKLLEIYLRQEIEELDINKVKLNSIGKISSLPKSIQKLLKDSIERTKENDGLTLTLALSYSGRWDIVRAVQMIGLDIRRGKISPEDINEELFSSYLLTHNLPETDLLIRTSGEMRLSNFMLWEMAYGEIYITDKYWPEFRRQDLYLALSNFLNRERRFGKTSLQLKDDLSDNNQSNSYFNRVINAFKNI